MSCVTLTAARLHGMLVGGAARGELYKGLRTLKSERNAPFLSPSFKRQRLSAPHQRTASAARARSHAAWQLKHMSVVRRGRFRADSGVLSAGRPADTSMVSPPVADTRSLPHRMIELGHFSILACAPTALAAYRAAAATASGHAAHGRACGQLALVAQSRLPFQSQPPQASGSIGAHTNLTC